jgi:hypothetical protein
LNAEEIALMHIAGFVPSSQAPHGILTRLAVAELKMELKLQCLGPSSATGERHLLRTACQ